MRAGDFARARAGLLLVVDGVLGRLGLRMVVGNPWLAEGRHAEVKGVTVIPREACRAESCREWTGVLAETRFQWPRTPSSSWSSSAWACVAVEGCLRVRYLMLAMEAMAGKKMLSLERCEPNLGVSQLSPSGGEAWLAKIGRTSSPRAGRRTRV